MKKYPFPFILLVTIFVVLTVLTSLVYADTSSVAIINDSFESSTLDSWKIDASGTDATAHLVSGGHLSPQCLEVIKNDTAGMIIISRTAPVTGGHTVQITADINSLFVGPSAEYFTQVQQLDATGKIITQQAMAFDDGFAVSSAFGGSYKTPQTLSEWKTTRHIVTLDAKTTQLVVRFVFRKGAQKVLLDNVLVNDLGINPPAAQVQPFYQKDLNVASASVDLDMLIPGFTYEITTTTSTPKNEGMGISWNWQDRNGKLSDLAGLPLQSQQGNVLVYRLTVPERAVEVLLQLHNDDLINIGWNHEAEYRKWSDISIRQLNGLPVIDTLFNNYIHHVSPKPQLTKPPGLIDMTPDDISQINAELANRPVVDASVVTHNGGMAIQLGNDFVPPQWASALPGLNILDQFGQVGKQGINIMRVSANRSGAGFDGSWIAPGKYDFSKVDAAIYRALKQNINADIIFNICGVYPPYWWGDAHPDQIVKDNNGLSLSIYDTYAYNRLWGKMDGGALHREHEKMFDGNNWLKDFGAQDNTTYFPSPASQSYRDAMKDYLTALRQHIESQPYGKAVIGYMIMWGYDAQWAWPQTGNNDQTVQPDGTISSKSASHLMDYSAPMLKYFQDYLRRVYSNQTALRAAWNDPKVSFETAQPPTANQLEVEKVNDMYPYLLDPAKDRQIIDWQRCKSEVIGNLANDLGMAIKSAGTRKVLVSGYFQDIDRAIGTDVILNGSGIDIMGGPNYTTREIGQSGISPFTFSSYQLHNKIEFTEVDHRVFSVMSRAYRGNQVFETPRKSIDVLQREFGRQIVRGDGAWTFDMGYGWYNQPILSGTLGDIHRNWEKVFSSDRSSVARVAMFVGDYPVHSRAIDSYVGRLYYLQEYVRSMLSQSGVAYDVYRMADLPKVADHYQVFIFPCAYALTDSERQSINALKNKNHLLVFGPAAGFVNDSVSSLDNVASLTGMQLTRDDKLPFTVKWRDDNPLIKDVSGYIGSEEDSVDFPVFSVSDPKAVSLANYMGHPDSSGIAYKDLGDWQSIYIGALGLYPPQLWRGIAALKKIPIYSSDGDPLWADKSLVAVQASWDGIHTINLPQKSQVTDLWSGRNFGSISQLKIQMKTGDNLLLWLH